MYHFCTYFDKNYLLRGITLYRSLLKHCEIPFRFYALCLDQETFDILGSLGDESIIPVKLEDIESWDKELLVAKQNRSLIEYYFTLSPVFPLYVLEHFDVDIVTYLDADLMFFSSPKAIYEELGDASIFITEHGFPEDLKHLEIHGVFNVQCQVFRADRTGIECLERWKKQCLEWCFDRLEKGKYADQKYIDEWPGLYGNNLVISKNKGVGVAPWNIKNKKMVIQGSQYYIDDEPLVFYHFHGFKEFSLGLIKTGLGDYKMKCNSSLRKLYENYSKALYKERMRVNIFDSKDIRYSRSLLKQLYIFMRQRDILWIKK